MLLRILHRTRYRYHGTIDMAQHMVHLSPRDTPTQKLLAHTLHVRPEPSARSQTTDAFGNLRTFFSLQAPHDTLTVEADSLVETQAPRPLPDSPAWQQTGWESVRKHFRYRAHAPYDPACEFLFASPYVPRDDAFAAFARPAFTAGLPVLETARALMERIHTQLRYETDSTEVNTPALQALEQGKGVCQDFAHIMLGCLRSLGLPARYVSGYLLTQPPPGKPRLIGADASHAWVSVYVPLPAGASADGGADADDEAPAASEEALAAALGGAWFDFDPTNNRCGWGSPGEDYVTLAIGRDFSDVSPMRGVIQGGARHTLHVGVTVAPPDEIADLLDGA
ncbi:MAG: transglutaminase [Burkholderiales bacterium RIFCSPLOWO2_12_67_14]|nr:MAG: transglutaminase [Burkholderiales bacterium RIFCSPLOWO2_02_FULL_67_64]OGB37459.1 MAG: transglutaminase [Burkholderiales bacterium RIFCSPHIGHO2_12_FULL_67_38]OGB50260.1 MAG: transglutaminase [Burkholderiales bacterium RIFCSPLOWO2_12_67_14]OGB93547.1 MAG: transglutaminase [Burkholderiales bacterium RIFCSPLOWO2_12_FULL_67_210]